ncbi:hypothetical protein Tco_1335468 [Tanacetum coccineum]
MWESEDLIENPINWDKPPKNGDGAWHAKIRNGMPRLGSLIRMGKNSPKPSNQFPPLENFLKKENPREIIDLDHFHDT